MTVSKSEMAMGTKADGHDNDGNWNVNNCFWLVPNDRTHTLVVIMILMSKNMFDFKCVIVFDVLF